jgi:hypothetical protein
VSLVDLQYEGHLKNIYQCGALVVDVIFLRKLLDQPFKEFPFYLGALLKAPNAIGKFFSVGFFWYSV